jgi:uncharacterized membrane protein YedE/YeeE
MTEFTPLSATLGGVLIGLAASILLLGLGRVAGISGILGQACFPTHDEPRGWRFAFLLGLPLGAMLVSLAAGPFPMTMQAGPLGLAVAGVLVGFGTRLGNGCTSGHGVCGIGRGSKRSIAATLTFMGTAAITVFVLRHLTGAGA